MMGSMSIVRGGGRSNMSGRKVVQRPYAGKGRNLEDYYEFFDDREGYCA